MKQNAMKLGFGRKQVVALALVLAFSVPSLAAAQMHFNSPEVAMESLVDSLATNDEGQMRAIIGNDYRKLLPLDDVSHDDLISFLEAWAKGHRLLMQGDKRAQLELSNGWVLPIPLVHDAAGWRFDTQAAQKELVTRRIGRNELAVLDAMHKYAEAQIKYATQDHDGNGVLEYSQKIMSTPGTQDGLLWVNESGELVGLVDPLLDTQELKEGYYGYHFKVLKAQGDAASGGALNYLSHGQMTEGFGLVAWPVRFGDSGVMTFIVNQDGQVYEKSLGKNSAALAKALTHFNPDASWVPVPSNP